MAQKEGLEPPTQRLTAACSTNWATSEHCWSDEIKGQRPRLSRNSMVLGVLMFSRGFILRGFVVQSFGRSCGLWCWISQQYLCGRIAFFKGLAGAKVRHHWKYSCQSHKHKNDLDPENPVAVFHRDIVPFKSQGLKLFCFASPKPKN